MLDIIVISSEPCLACHSLLLLFHRDNRRNSAFGLAADPSPGDGAEAINEALLDRPVAEAYNSAMLPDCDATPTSSVVSQKAAFFAQVC